MLDFEKLENIAKDLMLERHVHLTREIGSVYYHGMRVSRAVLRLRKMIFPLDDSMDECLRAAGLLHDIGKGVEPHGHYGAVLARHPFENDGRKDDGHRLPHDRRAR